MGENDPSNRKPIPAYRDTFVHFLFGTPGNEPILLHFLNAVLESDGQLPAKSVEMRNPFNPQTFVTEVHDSRCQGNGRAGRYFRGRVSNFGMENVR
jgi:hypothetical protein